MLFRMNRYGLVLAYAYIIHFAVSIDPEVTTTNGKVRGYSQTSYNSKIVSTYLGIPFATPPTGDLRFQRPIPVQNWTGTLECKKLPNSCPQIKFNVFKGKAGEKGEEMWNYNTNSSEDCLYLNIWAPVSTTKKLSTLVWIFGGGFIYGTSTLSLYDGTYLAAYRDVIIVSINYRVGPFGFLYMGTDRAPGNAGLIDQVVALKWIYNNIEYFGGTKDSITLFGESAGAASVSYLLASDLSKNYFQRAILQSASLLGSWAYQSPEIAIRYAQDLAKIVSCGDRNKDDTVACLKQVPVDDLTNKAWDLNITHVQWPFAPTIDNYFIKKSPTEIMKTEKFVNKDILLGFNTDEGAFFLLYYLLDAIPYPASGNMTWERFLAEIPKIVSTDGYSQISKEKDKLLFDAILFYYNAWSPEVTSAQYFDILDDIAGDFNFKCPVADLAEILASYPDRNASVFGYFFDQHTSVSDWPDWTGVLHGDEIEYIFGVPLKSTMSSYSSNEQWLSRYMMEYWTNFAKTGQPDVQRWKNFTASNNQYAVLAGGRELAMQTIDYTRTCQFWSKYIPKLKAINAEFQARINSGWKANISMLILVLNLALSWIVSMSTQ